MDNNPREVERTDYIKPYAVVKLGEKVATIIADGYNSASGEEKLHAIIQIAALSEEELNAAAKLKFMGDIIKRHKSERIKIANKLYYLLSSQNQNVTKSIPEDEV